MESTALTTVREYHAAWTSKEFVNAANLLAEDLVVEVPINSYPTKASFAEALAGFGSTVTSVALLSEMSEGDEAIQLYDMQVAGLGAMRVVEHFTVQNGRIVRLRQIHDTALLRTSTP
jgi:ketosteroid isomerase-like protein